MAGAEAEVPDDLNQQVKKNWKLPQVHSGGTQVPLEDLHQIAAEDEEMRSLGER